jgi:microcin C transport system substrate-binding protein
LDNSSKFWATAFDIPAIKRKELIKKVIPHKANSGVQAFAFNIRKTIFKDIELRKAISYAFDFEWTNKTRFYNAYHRSYSFFTNSEFSAKGLPSADELKLLNPYKSQLPSSVFLEEYKPPQTDGSGWARSNLRKAKKLLDDNGYVVKENQLYNKEGQAIRFEILLRSPTFERIINPFAKNLSRLGITATPRSVDASQFINRRRSFDFDVLVHSYPQLESLGSEQRNFWGSEVANTQGSENYIGINNSVIDSLIENVVNAKNRKELVVAGRALDRVLLHNHYIVPQWYKASTSIVYWDKFGIPDITPIYDNQYRVGILTWWYDAKKANKLKIKAE